MFEAKTLSLRWVLILLVLVATPAVGDDIIYNGVDVWRTPEGGSSFIDFSHDPIPAGFFCSGSQPFSGRIVWHGSPLATTPPNAFGKAVDTVIHRLDNATFNKQGVAVTRLQVAALSLIGAEPIQTSCGTFQARATLAPGEQPLTEMRIVRTREDGGHFQAPLSFIARISFTPVKTLSGEYLEIDRAISFPAARGAQWTAKPRGDTVPVKGFTIVDTNGDNKADTFLPGTSNFFPFGRKGLAAKYSICNEPGNGPSDVFIRPDDTLCHDSGIEGKCHCTYP